MAATERKTRGWTKAGREAFLARLAETSNVSASAGPRVMADSPARIQGFAANGDSVRGVAETLAGLFPFAVRDDGEVLQLEAMPKFYEGISDIDLGARQDDNPRDLSRIDAGR